MRHAEPIGPRPSKTSIPSSTKPIIAQLEYYSKPQPILQLIDPDTIAPSSLAATTPYCVPVTLAALKRPTFSTLVPITPVQRVVGSTFKLAQHC